MAKYTPSHTVLRKKSIQMAILFSMQSFSFGEFNFINMYMCMNTGAHRSQESGPLEMEVEKATTV